MTEMDSQYIIPLITNVSAINRSFHMLYKIRTSLFKAVSPLVSTFEYTA